MDEFRNKQTLHGLIRGEFAARRLALFAVREFAECPKFVTIARHTNLSETTPVACHLADRRGIIQFQVPKQQFNFFRSRQGLKFTATKVLNDGVSYWLVVCEETRRGFLLPRQVLDTNGHLTRSRRLRPSRVYH